MLIRYQVQWYMLNLNLERQRKIYICNFSKEKDILWANQIEMREKERERETPFSSPFSIWPVGEPI